MASRAEIVAAHKCTHPGCNRVVLRKHSWCAEHHPDRNKPVYQAKLRCEWCGTLTYGRDKGGAPMCEDGHGRAVVLRAPRKGNGHGKGKV